MSKTKSVPARLLEFLNGIRGEYLHPMVICHGINRSGLEYVSVDSARWILSKLFRQGKIKRRKQYGIRGNISYHYAGLTKGDIDAKRK